MSVACFVKCWTHANIIKAIQLEEKLNCIPREMYLQIQEELARRNSKKPANAKKQKLENLKVNTKTDTRSEPGIPIF